MVYYRGTNIIDNCRNRGIYIYTHYIRHTFPQIEVCFLMYTQLWDQDQTLTLGCHEAILMDLEQKGTRTIWPLHASCMRAKYLGRFHHDLTATEPRKWWWILGRSFPFMAELFKWVNHFEFTHTYIYIHIYIIIHIILHI